MSEPIVQAVIFDLDGLLLDTEKVELAAYLEAATRLEIDATEELFIRLVGRNRRAAEIMVREALGAADARAMLAEWTRAFESRVAAGNIPKKPGADEVLEMLTSLGTPFALATSSDRDRTTLKLRSAGLLDYFPIIASGDEVSDGKPAPDIFLLAAGRLDIQPSGCLVLEDSEPGVRAAHRAGMRVLIVPDLKQPSPDVAALAEGVFDSLADAQEFLEGTLGR